MRHARACTTVSSHTPLLLLLLRKGGGDFIVGTSQKGIDYFKFEPDLVELSVLAFTLLTHSTFYHDLTTWLLRRAQRRREKKNDTDAIKSAIESGMTLKFDWQEFKTALWYTLACK